MIDADKPSPGTDGLLVVLDGVAEFIIEGRALLLTLPPEQHGELRVLTDTLLMALGRRIAGALPPAARTALASDAP